MQLLFPHGQCQLHDLEERYGALIITPASGAERGRVPCLDGVANAIRFSWLLA